tara:strand:+ start:5353 stop:6078 length:726 start_codon:yes stop_codon:yes gene_type:complete
MKKLYLLTLTLLTFSLSAQVSVTHRVDVTDYLAGGATLDPSGIRIAGNFADNGANTAGTAMVNWSPTDAAGAMSDADGDNIWEITIDYPSSGDTLYYKFVNGDWGADESVNDTLCGGGGGFGTDRIFAIPASNTGYTYCWASCTQCDGSAASILENNVSNLKLSPNPSNGLTTFYFDSKNANMTNISVYEITGKLVHNVLNTVIGVGSHAIEYNTSSLNAGVYIYKLSSGTESKTGKLIKK